MRSTRVRMLLVLAAAAVSTSSSATLGAAGQNQPGLPTIAQVQVLNRDRSEAIPVKVQGPVEVLPVTFVGTPTVTLPATTLVTARVPRQAWEYRQLTTGATIDATTALNGAGADGWELVAVTPSGGSSI